MALVQRLLSATITLASGTFTEGGGNTVKLDGLRMSSKIVKAGTPSMGQMNLTVFGMTLSQMNQLATLGMQISQVPRNSIVLSAGDTKSGMAIVYAGNITNAYADLQAAPENAFHIEAHAGLSAAVLPAAASSFSGSADVATLMSGFASQMNLGFENNGVNVKLSNPYYPGSYRDQAMACASAAGIKWDIDNGILAIWPKGGARGGSTPLVSADTGLVGYPTYVAQGIMIKTLFNPAINFGGKIEVKTDLKTAVPDGIWAVYSLEHDLDTLLPGGQWFSVVGCINPNYSPRIS